jgi:F0F1-type ATP synthase membrane subunit b/b'
MFFQIFNFTIYVLIVAYLFKSKLTPVLKARSVTIEQQLMRGASEKAQAVAELQRIREQMSEIKAEQISLREALQAEGARTADAILERAKHECERMGEDAHLQRAYLYSQLESSLKEYVARKALKSAEVYFSKNLDANLDNVLRGQVIEQFAVNQFSSEGTNS